MAVTARPRPITRLLFPFREFARIEASAGILLVLATVAALVWVNSGWSHSYEDLWSTSVTLGLGDVSFSKSLHLWINDGLMAVFFFVVGLEIKREILAGQLSTFRTAILPGAAALGGMLVPALLYSLVNAGGPTAHGWGIPMATDIAFTLGALALLGTRAPASLKVFLTALAIADDLGAILVVALFFTESLSAVGLAAAAGFTAALVGANLLGIRQPIVYFLLSVGLWLAFLESGVHPTIAGVVAAWTIPTTTLISQSDFLSSARRALDRLGVLEAAEREGPVHEPGEHQALVSELERAVMEVQSPAARLEHRLHPWMAFGIMPVFALANAGVEFSGGFTQALGDRVALGVIVGLLLGKPVGIVLSTWLAVRTGVAELPNGLGWRAIIGGGALAGIGFTMSLFITGLAFGQSVQAEEAKAGILVGSLLSGVAGAAILWRGKRDDSRARPGPGAR